MEIRLYEILKRRRMSMTELADRMGVKQPNISSYQKSPTLKTMQELANALDIPVWELLVDCGEQMPADTSNQNDDVMVCGRCGAEISAQVVVTFQPKNA